MSIKKIRHQIAFCLLLLPLMGCPWPHPGPFVPLAERPVEMVREVNLTKDQIYSKSLEWMALNFTDSKDVIEVKDKENGKIIGKGITSFMNSIVSIPCRFTMVIDIKQGKYRVTFDNFFGLFGELHENPILLENKNAIDQVKEKLIETESSLYSFLMSTKKDKDF